MSSYSSASNFCMKGNTFRFGWGQAERREQLEHPWKAELVVCPDSPSWGLGWAGLCCPFVGSKNPVSFAALLLPFVPSCSAHLCAPPGLPQPLEHLPWAWKESSETRPWQPAVPQGERLLNSFVLLIVVQGAVGVWSCWTARHWHSESSSISWALSCAPRAAREAGQGARLPLLVMIPWKKGSGRRGARRVSRKGGIFPLGGARFCY